MEGEKEREGGGEEREEVTNDFASIVGLCIYWYDRVCT
jgi:hypothetical protein